MSVPSSISFVKILDRDHKSEHRTDWDETQSTRGENQARPTSSGGYQTGGSGTNNASTAGPGGYTAGQSENANSLLSPSHGLDANDHDAAATYGYPSAVPAGMSGDY